VIEDADRIAVTSRQIRMLRSRLPQIVAAVLSIGDRYAVGAPDRYAGLSIGDRYAVGAPDHYARLSIGDRYAVGARSLCPSID
jgi:hypothetical protein